MSLSLISHYPLSQVAGLHSVALIANGAVHDMPWISALVKGYPAVIAVDGGLTYCHQMGIVPDLIIGDLDSVSVELLDKYKNVPIEKFPTDKNWTDLELAILAVNSPQMEKIAIFGALEGRTDHALNNLHLARRYPGKVIIESERETIMTVQGTHTLSVVRGQTLSLIPLGCAAKGVTTQGLKWELHEATLDKDFVSISNICMESEVRIEIAEGDLICCLSREM